MVRVSKIELNLTHFYTSPRFYCLFGNVSPTWIRNNLKFWKRVIFGEVMGKRNIWPLKTQYMATWLYGHNHVNRTSLVLKIHPNTGQTSGPTAEGKKKMYKSERRILLTVDTLKILYCCTESPWCRMKPTHFVTKLENQ